MRTTVTETERETGLSQFSSYRAKVRQSPWVYRPLLTSFGSALPWRGGVDVLLLVFLYSTVVLGIDYKRLVGRCCVQFFASPRVRLFVCQKGTPCHPLPTTHRHPTELLAFSLYIDLTQVPIPCRAIGRKLLFCDALPKMHWYTACLL